MGIDLKDYECKRPPKGKDYRDMSPEEQRWVDVHVLFDKPRHQLDGNKDKVRAIPGIVVRKGQNLLEAITELRKAMEEYFTLYRTASDLSAAFTEEWFERTGQDGEQEVTISKETHPTLWLVTGIMLDLQRRYPLIELLHLNQCDRMEFRRTAIPVDPTPYSIHTRFNVH